MYSSMCVGMNGQLEVKSHLRTLNTGNILCNIIAPSVPKSMHSKS